MNTPKYVDQFNKLTEAYIHNEVDPWNCCACFVGNLLNRKGSWVPARDNIQAGIETGKGTVTSCITRSNPYFQPVWQLALLTIKEESNDLYNPQDIADLEALFLHVYHKNGGDRNAFKPQVDGIGWIRERARPTPQDEEALFRAFEAALELLKKIHIEKGEIIDDQPVFVKRQLEPVN